MTRFLAVAAQFGLLVWLVGRWEIEDLRLYRVLQIAFVAFIIHHFLPPRFRLPFFSAVSLGTVLLVLGGLGPGALAGLVTGRLAFSDLVQRMLPGLALIGVGLALIGICHLPIRLGIRIGLLLAAGGGLAWARANEQWAPSLADIWPILGSMFIFRLMVYLYDLKHRSAPFSPARSIAYFFMLPNVCYPLFPLVDYKTFCSTYYNENWPRIFQTGVTWMLRGVVHLLLYRVVYQLAPLDLSTLSSTLDVAGFVVATYLLYLRVSGQFHLIVGLLHMFGFNLPETHHLYLLSSSFTDFWRRINIYWKDFIMKLFFYPVFFACRKHGTLRAMTLATLAAFFCTWLLHSWQWFWIRGSFLFSWQDATFWAVLAVLVLGNAIYEAKSKRQRKLASSRMSLRERLAIGLKTIATFTVLCCLWTLWSSHSWSELATLARVAAQPTLRDAAVILAGLTALGACAMLLARSTRDTSEGRSPAKAEERFVFWPLAGRTIGVAAMLLLAPVVAERWFPQTHAVVAALRADQLNQRDINLQRRGYYEELDIARANQQRWLRDRKPAGWDQGRQEVYVGRSDFLMTELVPSKSVIISGARLTTNSKGFRDREYAQPKPSNTYRFVLCGSSHEMGMGVEDDATFENLLEDALNREQSTAAASRYEIVNLSVMAYSILQKLVVLERVGFDYQPDAVLFCVHALDRQFLVRHLSSALRGGRSADPEYAAFLDDVYRRADVSANLPDLVVQQRLQPFVTEVYGWVLGRLAELCAEREVRPLVVYRPIPLDQEHIEDAGRAELSEAARSAGLDLLDLSPAFEAVEDRKTLILAEWDEHTSVLGHQLLAQVLLKELPDRLPTPPSPRLWHSASGSATP